MRFPNHFVMRLPIVMSLSIPQKFYNGLESTVLRQWSIYAMTCRFVRPCPSYWFKFANRDLLPVAVENCILFRAVQGGLLPETCAEVSLGR